MSDSSLSEAPAYGDLPQTLSSVSVEGMSLRLLVIVPLTASCSTLTYHYLPDLFFSLPKTRIIITPSWILKNHFIPLLNVRRCLESPCLAHNSARLPDTTTTDLVWRYPQRNPFRSTLPTSFAIPDAVQPFFFHFHLISELPFRVVLPVVSDLLIIFAGRGFTKNSPSSSSTTRDSYTKWTPFP